MVIIQRNNNSGSRNRPHNREKFCKQRAKLAGRLCMIQKAGSGGYVPYNILF